MIKMLRIDERLIHGQVAVVWSKALSITHIIVANDDVVNNELQITSMKMAVPDNIKFIARDVKDRILQYRTCLSYISLLPDLSAHK